MRQLLLVGCLAMMIVGVLAVTSASAEPASVASKRAEVERIQGQLAEIDSQVEHAAEAYNGARYRLTLIQDRMRANRRDIVRTRARLVSSRGILAERLRQIYANPQPDLVAVVMMSGGLSGAVQQVEVLEQISEGDSALVEGVVASEASLRRARAQLEADEKDTRSELAEREAQRAEVQALLSQRRGVLSRAQGELGALLAAERRRQAEEAARQRGIAEARMRSAEAEAEAATAVEPAEGAAGSSTPAPSAAPAPPEPARGATPEPPALPDASGNAAAAQIAMRYLGTPYVWGGASPEEGFDCSGLASYAFAQIGKSVPHYTVAIYNSFPRVSREQLQPGDMVFFNGLGHMGIYIGGGQMVAAPQTGDVVKVSSIADRSDYVGAVRA